MTPSWATLLEQSLWAALAAVAFAVIFNVPPRGLAACATVAALGFCLRGTLVTADLSSQEIATLLAATVISLLSAAAGRLLHAPPLLFSIPGVIPFVPGTLALRSTRQLFALVSLAPDDRATALVAMLSDGFKALLIIAAMAGGVVIPSLLFRRKRPLT